MLNSNRLLEFVYFFQLTRKLWKGIKVTDMFNMNFLRKSSARRVRSSVTKTYNSRTSECKNLSGISHSLQEYIRVYASSDIFFRFTGSF